MGMVHSITTLILDLTTEQTINHQKKRRGKKQSTIKHGRKKIGQYLEDLECKLFQEAVT